METTEAEVHRSWARGGDQCGVEPWKERTVGLRKGKRILNMRYEMGVIAK